MTTSQYTLFENHMLACMNDSAHDKEHVYRVLYTALNIADHERGVNRDILIIACLLHDIGREAQFRDPNLCHAQIGSEMAYQFCVSHGISEGNARHIEQCILTHRYRGDNPPRTVEAKILFDADKLDAAGALGIARTLIYQGIAGQPLYHTDAAGDVLDGTRDGPWSFLREYNYKLKNVYDKFYTRHAAALAAARRDAAVAYYNSILAELRADYGTGRDLLNTALQENIEF